jgi:hypothetical protein
VTDPASRCAVTCSLSPAALNARRRLIAGLVGRATRPPIAVPGGWQLVFSPTPELEQQITALIALEADCCPFLTLRPTTRSRQVTLTITGPPEADAQLADLLGRSPEP